MRRRCRSLLSCSRERSRLLDRSIRSRPVPWPRVYQLETSVRSALKRFFPCKKLNQRTARLLQTEEAASSLSAAVCLAAHVLWTRGELAHKRLPTPTQLLTQRLQSRGSKGTRRDGRWRREKEDTAGALLQLPHADRLYAIFMRIQGRHKCLSDFAASAAASGAGGGGSRSTGSWADAVFTAFQSLAFR